MDNSPEKYVRRLKEASDKKCRLLQDMLSITEEQSVIFTIDTIDELERLIAAKQVKIDEINKIDEEFDVYFRRLKQELGVESLDELKDTNIEGLKELKETIKKIMGLLSGISNIESQNNEKAKDLLNGIGNEIKKINLGKRMSSAYGHKPVINPSYFIDKKK